MTPSALEAYCRQKYNAVSDTSFFTSAEIMDYITEACDELSSETYCIQGTDSTTTTVAATQGYAVPAAAIVIKRVEYDGTKLQPITFREDDGLTLSNSTTTDSGTPQYYYLWNDTVYLRPIPDDAKTLKFYYYKVPDTVTAVGTLEVPAEYHRKLSLWVLHCMALKDENAAVSDRYETEWEAFVAKARSLEKRKKRGDAPVTVQDVDSLPDSILGVV